MVKWDSASRGTRARRGAALRCKGTQLQQGGTGDGFPVIAGALVCWSSWAYVPVYLSREVFNCCIGAVTDRNPMANRLQTLALAQRATEGRCQLQIAFLFTLFSPSPNLHQDKRTDFTTVCRKGSSRRLCSCRAAASLAVHFSTLSFALSRFDLLGFFYCSQ